MGDIMRTFTLIDNDGNEYDVTTAGVAFFYKIDGLGFAKNLEYQRIEDRYALLSEHVAQQKITGTVKFWQPNAERAYFNFAQFCQNSPIRMRYNPGFDTFYRTGTISKIERSDGDNSLTAKIEFTASTPWYKILTAFSDGSITGGKVYNYKYDYVYSDSSVNSVTLDSDSYQSSPARVILYGELVNPTWRHYLNNVLQTTGKINGTVLPNHRLVIDTTTIPYSIKQVDAFGNVVSDMYQLSDFSTGRFVRLGYGVNTIAVSADNATELTISVEAEIEYATV